MSPETQFAVIMFAPSIIALVATLLSYKLISRFAYCAALLVVLNVATFIFLMWFFSKPGEVVFSGGFLMLYLYFFMIFGSPAIVGGLMILFLIHRYVLNAASV